MPARKCGSLRKGHSVRTAPGTRSETRKKAVPGDVFVGRQSEQHAAELWPASGLFLV